MKVSIFKNYSAKGRDVELSYVFEKIRTGAFKNEIEAIKNCQDPDEADALKKKLPGVTFCGLFTERKSSALRESTGLLILDFDDKEADFTPIENDPRLFAVWKSPRGGRKALIRIPPVKSDLEFKEYFYAIHQAFPEIDPSGKDISRFCFMSYDPELILREDAPVWTKRLQEDKPEGPKVKSDFKKLTLALQMIDKCEIGNRNNTILKAGRLMGGFISAGELNEIDVLEVCERAIYEKDHRDFKINFSTFRRGIDHGKQEPLTEIEITRATTEAKLGKIEYPIEEAEQELDDLFSQGWAKGYSTGWDHFDPYYSVLPGYTTYIYGSPFSGKTKWWFNLLVNLSKLHGLKHLIYSPETGSKLDVYALLIQIYAQGNITSTFGKQVEKTKFEEAKNFIGRHFIVISTDETDTDLSPGELLEYVDIVAHKYNITLNTVTLDPWNELRHEEESQRDLYLNKELKRIRVSARKKQRHIGIITHIRDQKPMGHDDFGTAIYPFPTPNDVAGGQVWYRKGFMMLSFYRHFVIDGYDNVKISKDRTFGKNQLLIRVQKFKPEGTGKRGEIEFEYHPDKHVFTAPGLKPISGPAPKNFYEPENLPF